MGETMIPFTHRLRRNIRKTDVAILLVCAFALSCSLLAHLISGHQTWRIPGISLQRAPVLLLPLFLWVASIIFVMMRRNFARPLRIIWRLLRRDPLWIIRAGVLLIVIATAAPTYSAFKLNIQHIIPFYADPTIIEFEATLFGQDPWRITHAVIGLNGTVLLDRLYVLWFPASAFLVTWASMTRDRVFQARAVSTIFFVWFALGNFLALALSSCGPVYYEHFYGNDRFAPLMETLRVYDEEVNIGAITISDWLISDEAVGQLGSGISALPSVHVAMAMTIWLLVQSRLGWKNPISAIVALYVAAIWVGSVHLAWHYWLDGAVSIVCTALFWKATGLWLKPKAPKPVSAPRMVQSEPQSAMPEPPELTEGIQAG